MREKKHILVVDDDQRIRELLKRFLRENNYVISTSSDALTAKKLLNSLRFDLISVDVMMPGEDGITLTRWLTKTIKTPILLLTAKTEINDRILGLESGAEDYLPKPFEPRELLLRIEIILRRVILTSPTESVEKIFSFGALKYNVGRCELWRSDNQIKLTPSEISILKCLVRNLRSPVHRHELAIEINQQITESKRKYVLAEQVMITDAQQRAVDVYVTRLRKKIEPNIKLPRYIRTVRGIGYMIFPD